MDLWNILMLIGGLGLFLYGMKLMSDGLEAAAGDKLRTGLELMTKNRFSALGLGAGVTAVIQSSSATTVMVVGFVNAGLMSLTQAINVGIGANIGTTITAQIVALKVTEFAPLVLFAGVIIMLFVKKRSVRRIGEIIGGLGILLFGMELMSEAVAPLRDYQPFIDLLSSFQNPWIGLLAGLAVTAIIQSSSATMGIIQAFAMQGVMGLDAAVYVILGLNIGTCVTAILASLSGTKTAKRTALALLFFNVIGAFIFMGAMQFLPIVDWIKSWTPGSPVNQLANFHTFFNVVNAFIFIGIPQVLTKIAYFFVRGEDKQLEGKKLKYIDKNADSAPVAVGQAILEVSRMERLSGENFSLAIKSFLERDEKLIDEVGENEKVVNYLNHEITDALANVSQTGLSEVDSRTVTGLLHVIMDIERISDIAQNIADIAAIRLDKKIKMSKKGVVEIQFMADKIGEAFRLLREALKEGNLESAQRVIEIEDEVDRYEAKIKKNHVKRLKKGECSAQASTVFTDVITMCERVADHVANIAAVYLRGEMQ
ncbi:Na/Pi cotransporter family protein [Christensenella intestinihominis]|uniref:Na/Pi cotransporter family protein n=1 Tax=Christensenella intestinihominis TaxID=1851429 RepID=UPI0008300735|nr:Na/Pi cotransporter family protein [Christensenella intestinihominis]